MIALALAAGFLIGGVAIVFDHGVIAEHCAYLRDDRAWAGTFLADVKVYDCGRFGEWNVID